MSFGKDKKVAEEEKNKVPLFEKWLQGLGHFVLNNRIAMLVIFVLAILAIAPGIPKVSTNMDIFRFMGTKIPYVKRVYDVTQSQLGSYLT